MLIKYIIYCNAAMYIVSLFMNLQNLSLSLNPMHFLSPGSNSLLVMGATGTIPIDQFHRWWSLLSANYLHGGILHIVFNMIALKQIAPMIIREYGVHRMFVIFTVSGCIGFYISYLAGIPLTIGSSASICGLIGAALYYGKSRGGTYGRAVYKHTGGWAAGIFLFGFLVPGINNWGHGGGMIAGGFMGLALGYREKYFENTFHNILFRICVLATGVTLIWAVSSGLFYRFFSH